jgi:hypothetical protein
MLKNISILFILSQTLFITALAMDPPGSDQRQEKAYYGYFQVVSRNYGVFFETYEFDESILDLKNRIKKEWGIPVEHQVILITGIVIPNEAPLRELRLNTHERMDLVVCVPAASK